MIERCILSRIGNVRVGDNYHIGANCVVVKDMPDNFTAVLRNINIIINNNSSLNFPGPKRPWQ